MKNNYLVMFTRVKKRNMEPKIIKNIGNIAKAFSPEEFGKIGFISFRGISGLGAKFALECRPQR